MLSTAVYQLIETFFIMSNSLLLLNQNNETDYFEVQTKILFRNHDLHLKYTLLRIVRNFQATKITFAYSLWDF